MTPITETMAAITEKLPAPTLRATAVKAGNILCGKEIGRALSIQNLILFIGNKFSFRKVNEID